MVCYYDQDLVFDDEFELLKSVLCISLQASCQTDGAHLITGHGDGSVLVYDIRSPKTWVPLHYYSTGELILSL